MSLKRQSLIIAMLFAFHACSGTVLLDPHQAGTLEQFVENSGPRLPSIFGQNPQGGAPSPQIYSGQNYAKHLNSMNISLLGVQSFQLDTQNALLGVHNNQVRELEMTLFVELERQVSASEVLAKAAFVVYPKTSQGQQPPSAEQLLGSGATIFEAVGLVKVERIENSVQQGAHVDTLYGRFRSNDLNSQDIWAISAERLSATTDAQMLAHPWTGKIHLESISQNTAATDSKKDHDFNTDQGAHLAQPRVSFHGFLSYFPSQSSR